MAEPAPGPWEVNTDSRRCVRVMSGRISICAVRALLSQKANARLISAAPILPDLYASEINVHLEWLWDGGFDVALGDNMNGFKAQACTRTFIEAVEWLRDEAIKWYPESEFAKRYAKADAQP